MKLLLALSASLLLVAIAAAHDHAEHAKLSPEAQALDEKIHAIHETEKEVNAANKAIDALLAGASESVKKELESVHHKREKREGHKSHNNGKRHRRTTPKA
ncbi:hypothetical protein PRIPAC_76207 [Pristionchus pacificus]|uniref:Uncharacterized protein n=1 Tax=Pristionchus pacificus TaxID=54126 RepID=A0A454Y1T0_PRIPA|nr:hypothetical protein PRIPAC_76207 [Pristionchus pacificus]|eukprot:PDM71929.1 hypothetical protein PRIPAC_38336 [Pristionchus pacificus]